jgi:hypothetical protein
MTVALICTLLPIREIPAFVFLLLIKGQIHSKTIFWSVFISPLLIQSQNVLHVSSFQEFGRSKSKVSLATSSYDAKRIIVMMWQVTFLSPSRALRN